MSDRLTSVVAPVAVLVAAVLAAFGLVAQFSDIGLGKATPSIIGIGIVYGALNALVTVGLILIYRSSRVLNFAQAGFGITALMVYLLLASVWHWNFWLASGVAVAGGAGVSWAVEVFLVRRFARSPRLVLTVVTIALAQTFGGFTLLMPRLWGFVPDPEDPTGGLASLPAVPPRTPFERSTFNWNGVVFNGNNLAAIVAAVVAMIGLTVFLRYTRVGTAVRGASENAERA